MVEVNLQPWSEKDLPLLQKLLRDPSMMAHLGGPETPEQIHKRHQRYLQLPEADHMFVIVWGPKSEAAGSIGYWEKSWRDQMVYEMGWFVLPAYQGGGLATKPGDTKLFVAEKGAGSCYWKTRSPRFMEQAVRLGAQ